MEQMVESSYLSTKIKLLNKNGTFAGIGQNLALAIHVFKEIVDYLNEGDCLVINNTKVIPARLMGVREGTGASIEVLLLKLKT